jgi:trans-aconitate 2-methyltransferase
MPTWNADQYLKFTEERTRPCHDLVGAIRAANVRKIIDLGCGPGNSTEVLARRWPEAEITGLDNALSMIDVARREQPQHRWTVADITEWASKETEQYDIVFSNAALQWVDDHASVYPKLFDRLRPGGALAVQIPSDFNALSHRLMREVAPPGLHVKEWYCHAPAFYYDVLASRAGKLDIWQIEYQHVIPNADAIVEWYKGSALRSFLEAMSSDGQREEFMFAFRERVRAAYQPQPDGKVLFPFLRLFVIAYKRE